MGGNGDNGGGGDNGGSGAPFLGAVLPTFLEALVVVILGAIAIFGYKRYKGRKEAQAQAAKAVPAAKAPASAPQSPPAQPKP